MKKQLIFLGVLGLLSGCTSSVKQGQQYVDGDLPDVLNQSFVVKSNAPRDFSSFAEQSALVTNKSPSMSATYAPLYQQLNEWALQSSDPQQLAKYGIQTAQLGGGDNKGNVLFTGYFSPVIELRHRADSVFKYPVYAKPDCEQNCPTRQQIYAGALAGKGLELGYAKSLIDPFIMEVQGSGFVHFGDDDSLEYFAYAGKNFKAYVSIGKVLIDNGEVARKDMSLKAIKQWVNQHSESEVRALLEENPSYVFFAPRKADPVTGTAGIPLLPMASVAGDKKWLPMGTPLLAEVPLLNADGSWSGVHVLRLLLVLDTGGAVKDNHLDLYHGMGPRAGEQAGHYKYFGRVWKLGLANSATQYPWVTPPEKAQ